MKKMNKMYEAPVAEMIEMQMPVVLENSANADLEELSQNSVPGEGSDGDNN